MSSWIFTNIKLPTRWKPRVLTIDRKHERINLCEYSWRNLKTRNCQQSAIFRMSVVQSLMWVLRSTIRRFSLSKRILAQSVKFLEICSWILLPLIRSLKYLLLVIKNNFLEWFNLRLKLIINIRITEQDQQNRSDFVRGSL